MHTSRHYVIKKTSGGLFDASRGFLERQKHFERILEGSQQQSSTPTPFYTVLLHQKRIAFGLNVLIYRAANIESDDMHVSDARANITTDLINIIKSALKLRL